jgi:hypothetical protein
VALPWVERPSLKLDLPAWKRGKNPSFPAEAIERAKTLLNEVLGSVPHKPRFLAYLLALRTLNRFGSEFKAGARIIQGDPRDLALANLSYELVVGNLGCSTIALPTPDGPIVARNMDWEPEGPLARASYVIRCEEKGQWQFSSAGFPGAVGVVTGLSARGFAVILNAVSAPGQASRWGYPVLLQMRRVMEDAADFIDAVRMLSRQVLTMPALFTVVGTRNEDRVVIERLPRRFVHRRATSNQEPLVTTNHYQSMDFASANDALELISTTCTRYDRSWALACRHTYSKFPSDSELLYWLSDPQVKQSSTCQHIIMHPASGRMNLYIPRELALGSK